LLRWRLLVVARFRSKEKSCLVKTSFMGVVLVVVAIARSDLNGKISGSTRQQDMRQPASGAPTSTAPFAGYLAW
jgi:hypothetical protein